MSRSRKGSLGGGVGLKRGGFGSRFIGSVIGYFRRCYLGGFWK